MAWGLVLDCDEHQLMLVNNNDETFAVNGMSSEASIYSSSWAIQMQGTFTVTSTAKQFIIKHWANTTPHSNTPPTRGMGRGLFSGSSLPSVGPDYNWGDDYGYDTYTSIMIWRID